MKFTTLSVAAFGLLASEVSAFPRMMTDPNSPLVLAARAKGAFELENRAKIAQDLEKRATAAPQGTGALPLVPPPFDAAAQYVSNQGQYAFVAPGAGDARGECPGLNAMANHGYLPHNGIATVQQFIDATYQVFGMAQDLSTFLAVFGAVLDGDLLGWSIEGGPHVGIAGSHGNYESDSSPLKSDLNQYGSNERLIMSQFYNLYNRQPNPATANYNLEVLRDFRASRFQESISKNPYFTYNFFAGIEVSQAAFTFIYRFMANKSAEYPEGILDKNTLKSFMSIYGPEYALYWKKGWERIPDNFYKRNDADQYSIPYFEADILYFAAKYPQILDSGCNTGTVNSYNTFNVSKLTGGAYTAETAAKNPICFANAVAAAEGPAFLGLNATQSTLLTQLLLNVTQETGYSCPVITQADFSELEACPGLSVYGGPTGYVAPGAIQS